MRSECRRYTAALALVAMSTGVIIGVQPTGSIEIAGVIIVLSALLLAASVWLELRFIATGGTA